MAGYPLINITAQEYGISIPFLQYDHRADANQVFKDILVLKKLGDHPGIRAKFGKRDPLIQAAGAAP